MVEMDILIVADEKVTKLVRERVPLPRRNSGGREHDQLGVG